MAGKQQSPRARGPQETINLKVDAGAVASSVEGMTDLIKAAGRFIAAAGPTNNRIAANLDAHMNDLRRAYAHVEAAMLEGDAGGR